MKRLLIIDDDAALREVLALALARRGFEARTAAGGAEALAEAERFHPEGILLDLKLGAESGLSLIASFKARLPEARIVMLTGYAGIATAVEAIKLGAVHYLAKPASIEEILDAFTRTGGNPQAEIRTPPTVAEVEWQHLRTALSRNGGNISATARELKMHRRTLQRKIDKMPARFAPQQGET